MSQRRLVDAWHHTAHPACLLAGTQQGSCKAVAHAVHAIQATAAEGSDCSNSWCIHSTHTTCWPAGQATAACSAVQSCSSRVALGGGGGGAGACLWQLLLGQQQISQHLLHVTRARKQGHTQQRSRFHQQLPADVPACCAACPQVLTQPRPATGACPTPSRHTCWAQPLPHSPQNHPLQEQLMLQAVGRARHVSNHLGDDAVPA